MSSLTLEPKGRLAPTCPLPEFQKYHEWGQYLYVQVKDTMAVQIVQAFHQLLDIDLDLWQRLGSVWKQPPRGCFRYLLEAWPM